MTKKLGQLIPSTPFTVGFSRIAAMISRVSTISGGLLLLLLHFLKPEVNWQWQFISEYALGRFGFMMNLVFFALAVGLLAHACALWFHARSITGRIGIVLTVVSATGMAIGALFNTDPAGIPYAEMTQSGVLHNIGGQLNLTPFAALFLTISLRRNPRWKGSMRKLVVATILVFLMVGCFIVSAAGAKAAFGPGTFTGLFGRLMLCVYLIWQLLSATPLLAKESSI
jgi:hypothetical protein